MELMPSKECQLLLAATVGTFGIVALNTALFLKRSNSRKQRLTAATRPKQELGDLPGLGSPRKGRPSKEDGASRSSSPSCNSPSRSRLGATSLQQEQAPQRSRFHAPAPIAGAGSTSGLGSNDVSVHQQERMHGPCCKTNEDGAAAGTSAAHEQDEQSAGLASTRPLFATVPPHAAAEQAGLQQQQQQQQQQEQQEPIATVGSNYELQQQCHQQQHQAEQGLTGGDAPGEPVNAAHLQQLINVELGPPKFPVAKPDAPLGLPAESLNSLRQDLQLEGEDARTCDTSDFQELQQPEPLQDEDLAEECKGEEMASSDMASSVQGLERPNLQLEVLTGVAAGQVVKTSNTLQEVWGPTEQRQGCLLGAGG
ncbi:hypothetical protein DUNSADRAFT_13321 [Dunaliella salina]|uniref:Encoded protein n=1 Tax=Dunaliella salina TaxID=3046 RepID=A0ABQ7G9J8_DUNSA|nr:hypothetical protein DUNSADRAFT_13321 [Dunaliella salina]|eukprot:KAF5831292.1 hypothetical protein DUNSADRAFT_13321 [Dunaliella salina]